VEDSPIICNVTDGFKIVGQVQVANPYALFNMKVRAAHDWFRYRQKSWPLRERQEPPSAKHAFDGALIVAMLTLEELSATDELSKRWSDISIADEIKGEAELLYGIENSPAWIEARRQGMFNDHALIWTAMKQALGMA
jgi:hypothetical protein